MSPVNKNTIECEEPTCFFFVFFAHAPLLYTLYVHTQPTKLCTREFTLDANEAAGLRRACTKQLVPLRKDERKKKKKKNSVEEGR